MRQFKISAFSLILGFLNIHPPKIFFFQNWIRIVNKFSELFHYHCLYDRGRRFIQWGSTSYYVIYSNFKNRKHLSEVTSDNEDLHLNNYHSYIKFKFLQCSQICEIFCILS